MSTHNNVFMEKKEKYKYFLLKIKVFSKAIVTCSLRFDLIHYLPGFLTTI